MRKRPRKSESGSPKSRHQVRSQFRNAGITIAEWARERGFSPRLVYTLLSSDRAAIRGKSHRAAIALGLKQAPAGGGE